MTNKEKREKIFDIFSQNLGWVKQHVRFEPDFDKGYICPLCFEIFFKKDLDISLNNFLSLEDVPPVSLGGKPLVLSCKECNSKSGHQLDVHLLNALLENDAKSFLPNSETFSTFEIDGNTLYGKIDINEKGQFFINFDEMNGKPEDKINFKEGLYHKVIEYNPRFHPNLRYTTRVQSKNMQMKFKTISDKRKAEVALLRIGYLSAFAKFGYGFLINENLRNVREQIKYPDKDILPKSFRFHCEFPDDCEGINMISLPNKLRCFLIVFRLKTKSSNRQFNIVLPGLDENSNDIYKNLEEYLSQGKENVTEGITFETLPEIEYLADKDLMFVSHHYWHRFTSEKDKPNFPAV